MKEQLKVFCNNCRRTTKHSVLKSEERTVNDESVQVSFYDCWQIIKCLGCEAVTFRHLSENSDDCDPDTGIPYESIRFYPIRGNQIIQKKNYSHAPPIVRSIYWETLDAYNHGLNLLCAAGLRSIIESICMHENIFDGPVESKNKSGIIKTLRKKNLEGKINGLEEKKIITNSQSAILHEHRYLGNESLHALDIPQKHILKIAIEIIENVLDMLFEIGPKARTLQWRREEKEKSKSKGTP